MLTKRALLAGLPLSMAATPAMAATSAHKIDTAATQKLHMLYRSTASARALGENAKGILIFPRIVKAGLIVGGQSGDGVLRIGGKSQAYYQIVAASFGLQIGAQAFSNVMFFMTESSLKYLRESDGWAIGTGPSVVVIDKGAAAGISSTTLSQDVYAFPFGQTGLMAGIGLEGSKITQIFPGA